MSSRAGPSSPPPASGTPAMPKSKHKLTPVEQQALAVERLLSNPDREIRLPSGPREKTLRAPREMMKNVSGSSAGAGSGEFHVYKHARRREYERIKLLEEKAEKEKSSSAFLISRAQQAANDEAKTNKNRTKRDKKKLAREKAKLQSAPAGRNRHEGTVGKDAKRKRGNSPNAPGKEAGDAEKKLKAAPGTEGLKFQARAEEGSEEDDEDDEDEDEV